MIMKIFYIWILLLPLYGWAQNKTVQVQFDHLVGKSVLSLNNGVYSNAAGQKMSITRAQFYLSGFEISTKDGSSVAFPDTYLLVNATDYGKVYDIGEVPAATEAARLRLQVGVDAVANHSDPSSYPSTHALANQEPSMHWGWTAGYRFLAIEGKIDTDGDQIPETIFQYHTVGDEYLTPLTIDSYGKDENNTLLFKLKADYAALLENIDFYSSANYIVHGGGETIHLLMSSFQENDAIDLEERTFAVGSKVNFAENAATIYDIQKEVKLVNLTTKPLSLLWQIVETQMPEGWVQSVCDTEGCWNINVTERNFTLGIEALPTDRLNMHFYPYNQAGTGTTLVKITNTASGEAIFVRWTATATAPVGISAVEQNIHLVCVPQPARETATLFYTFPSEIQTIYIYNLLGQTVFQQKIQQTQGSITLSQLETGWYQAVFYDAQGKAIGRCPISVAK